ncbi:hypothetical protein RUM44_012842 [Polyplax serrata]|uniref:Uncharacterized protein n=1 Tax=Polyplax serrata TaxID=468196 RepID=A0ABR1BCG2_POLSC
MAVPFLVQEDSEDCLRSLDFLLEQLLITLRQVIMLRRREAATSSPLNVLRHRHVASEIRTIQEYSSESLTPNTTPEEATRVSAEENFTQEQEQEHLREENNHHHHHQQHHHQYQHQQQASFLLPDVVLETPRTVSHEQKMEHRERTLRDGRTESGGLRQQGWVQVGTDLKRIADQLLSTQRLDQVGGIESSHSCLL